MLNINCVLSYLVNKYRVSEQYGFCNDELKELLACVSSYQWLYNNAWNCLDQCEKNTIDTFLKSNFNFLSFTNCTPTQQDCVGAAPPFNDECEGGRLMSYPTSSNTKITLSGLDNIFVCGEKDFPSDSGIPLPSTWALDSSGDLWYKFSTGSSSILNPYFTIKGGTIQYPQIAIYEGPLCSDISLVAENEYQQVDACWTKPTLDPNTTYYIRMSNSGGNTNTGTFTLYISLFPII